MKTVLLTKCNSFALILACMDVFGISFYYFKE